MHSLNFLEEDKMEKPQIYSMAESGAWNSEYMSHHQNAWHYYGDYATLTKRLTKSEKRHQKKGHACESLVFHLTYDLHQASYRAATSTHLFACLAMEGFLNFYGVRRLGEPYYKAEIERLPIAKKLEKIFLTVFGEPPSDLLAKSVLETFQLRNNLVHPKTQEITSSNIETFIDPHPRDHYVKKSMRTLNDFALELCANDPDLSLDFYFPKHN